MILEIPGALHVAPLNEEHVNAMAATNISGLFYACHQSFQSKALGCTSRSIINQVV